MRYIKSSREYRGEVEARIKAYFYNASRNGRQKDRQDARLDIKTENKERLKTYSCSF